MRKSTRSTSQGRQTQQAQVQGATDMMRVRKELIQSRSKIADLQDELEEKTSLYLNAIKMRDQYAEKLNNARGNINRVEEIVGQKVNVAMENERREMMQLRGENDTLKLKLQSMDEENKSLRQLKSQLNEQIHGLQEDLAFYSRNQDVKESINKVNQLRKEKEAAEKKINTLMAEINNLSNVVDDMTAENRQLRRMANVPDNYGIPLETIKLYDKERIEDFKKLIKVLQDDNYKLEEERANLKHQLKLQAMMYKSSETDPALRYKNLTNEQLQSVDTYVINLLQGKAHEPADFYKLKKENEQLKTQLEVLQNTGFEQIQRQMQAQFANLGGSGAIGGQTAGGGGNLNQDQLKKLMIDNENLQRMVQQLIDGIPQGHTIHQNVVAGIDSSRGFVQPGQFRPPQPGEPFDGEITRGYSYKFDNSEIPLYDKSGKHGIRESNVYENAFLQLQLKEAFELNHRQNEQIANQKRDIEDLYKKIRGYLLTQDQLYKDCLRIERHYEKKEKLLKENMRKTEALIQEEKDKCSKVEAALRAVQTNDQNSMQAKVIELTKQNSLLDLNLLRLTRKYQNLEEQEKMLRREYHAKDSDMAEKDRFVQERINSLKEWKANAMTQLQFLFQKLRIAVPISDLQAKNKQLEISTQRVNDMNHRTGKQAQKILELQKQLRKNEEASEDVKVITEEKEALEEEFEIIKKRLEYFDTAFKFENQIYQKIANILKRANVSPLQAFQEFDEDGSGSLDKEEFSQALEKLRVTDLSKQEFNLVWQSLDANDSGNVDYKEFVRKLEQYGVKNLGRNENILYQLAKAMQRQNIQMSDFFEMIDKHRRGYITREDFKDMFANLRDSLPNLNESELDAFIENFWRDKSAGIDYKGFLRIFKKYEIKVANERSSKGTKAKVIIKDETIILKKDIFDKIQHALEETNQELRDLFKMVDVDQSAQIEVNELFSMFQQMRQQVTLSQTHAIFESVDFDGNGSISLPEFQSDFKNVVNSTLEELLMTNRHDNQAQLEAGAYDALSMVDTMNLPSSEAKEIQMQNKITRLEAKEKRLQKRLTDMFMIMNNSEQSCAQLQQLNNGLERENDKMHELTSRLKEQLSMYEANQAHSMPKEDADNMAQENERLITVYNETRAAMLSYKKMCEVIADQAKNLKLMHERKRDEHENLLEALREMQSEGATKERIGKLYFVIMLSRWQEASVNKKYEAVITEVKDLRTELINSQALVSQREIVIEHNETIIREGQQKIVSLNHEVSKSQGVYMDESKGQELSRINQNLSDELTELENEFFQMRTKFREMQDTYDQAKASAEEAQNLSNKLKLEHNDEQSRNLIEMSAKLQKDRLKKYQLSRKMQEQDEKLKWLERLNKNKDDAIFKLETKCAKAEGEMHRVKEEYRQLDNERQRKFLRSRFDVGQEGGGRPGGSQGGPAGRAGAQERIGDKIASAGALSATGTQRIGDEAADRGLERIRRQQTDMHGEQGVTGGADWATKQMLEEQTALNKKLQERLTEMAAMLNQRDSEVGRLRMWQEGDKYLSEDIVLKDAIEDHRLKTLAVAEKEQKEISDAAYQTVKTLQEMIEQKNEQLKRKEENITRLREQMKQQAQLDANTINELREQNAATGNTTMNKLHQIVSKHEASAVTQTTGGHHTQNATNAFNRKAQEELTRKLAEKDHIIEQLRAGNQGASKEKEIGMRKNADLRNQVEALKEELRREKERVDIKAANKKLLRLQKEKTDQDKVVANLRKAIDEFQKRMITYESEKVQMQETDNIAQKKISLNAQEANKDKEVLNNKIKIVENQRSKLTEENKELKVNLNRKEEEVQALKTQKDESVVKLQEKLQELNNERREKQRVQNQLNRYQEENKIGGEIEGGRMSYAQLEERNRELERDNRILEAQKATVVTKNAEHGTFEYIGTPMPLNQGNPNNDPKTVSEVVERMTLWLQKHDRITVGGIFRSLDRGGFGELREREFLKACERIGIQLSANNLQKLKSVLDHRSTSYLKYGPLVQQLSGIPTKEFLSPPIEKLAELVRTKDYLPEDFKQLIDPRNAEQMRHTDFKNAMVSLRSADFEIYDEEINKIFTDLTKQARVSSSAVLQVDELIKQIYDAVKAVMIHMMQQGLKKSRKFLVDLLAARDQNRDGYLEYQEFEDMLLTEMQVPFYPKLFETIVIEQLMDPGKRQNKIKNEVIKMFLGEGEQAGMMVVDMVPSQENVRKGPSGAAGAASRGTAGGRQQQTSQANQVQQKMLQSVSRKVLMGFQGTLGDALNKEDPKGDGLIPIDTIKQVVDAKNIQALQPSELQFLLSHCDSNNFGFVIISNFHAKLLELAQETEAEVKLRRFAKSIGNQGLNLKAELAQYDRTRKGELDQVQFKRAIKQLAVALTDPEIKELYETGLSLSKNGGSGQLEIATFVAKVIEAQKSKPLPAYLNAAAKPGSKVGSRIGQGVRQAQADGEHGSQFENWEIEKKYKRNLEALKHEIEERNKELLLSKKEVQNINARVLRLEEDKQELENRLIDKNAKPPREMQSDSQHIGNLDEIQKLKDEIFHLQQVNNALQKTMSVGLKAELSKVLHEKELLEDKLKNASEKLRNRNHEVQMLIGQPKDDIAQRETAEETRQKRIDELENDLIESEAKFNVIQEQLFKAEEKNLDLKFEKETFDLQYARLQKRITDLEQYKLQSSAISANLQNARAEELATIKEQTAKVTGEQFSSQGDTVKLRNKKLKSVQELETVIDKLTRVVDKQKVDMENLKKENQQMKDKTGDENSAQEAQKLRRRILDLEQALHSAEMKEVNMNEQEHTMKKLLFANNQLREDLSREIERYNLLEDKFRDLLVKYNLAQKENEKNQKLVFTLGTGANLPRYDNFLDEGGEFTSGRKRGRGGAAATYDLGGDDELNRLNREAFDGL